MYALAVGYGSTPEEKQFVYEEDPAFEAVATFCLTWTFWVDKGEHVSMNRIPCFPPPLMAQQDVIPRAHLRSDMDLSDCPVIHTWQSVVWHQRRLPTPNPKLNSRENNEVKVSTDLKIVSVIPKAVGTFVTSQSQVMNADESMMCTLQSTALVLGIPPEDVKTWKDPSFTRQKLTVRRPLKEERPTLIWSYQTHPNTAFLYRIASGDSNHIHVDSSAAEQLGKQDSAPLLHGLYTLAVAYRALRKVCDGTILKLEGRFSQPAFVGDTLQVKVWQKSDRQLYFIVENQKTGVVLVNNGCAEFHNQKEPVPTSKL